MERRLGKKNGERKKKREREGWRKNGVLVLQHRFARGTSVTRLDVENCCVCVINLTERAANTSSIVQTNETHVTPLVELEIRGKKTGLHI